MRSVAEASRSTSPVLPDRYADPEAHVLDRRYWRASLYCGGFMSKDTLR